MFPLGCRGQGRLVGADVRLLVGAESPPPRASLRGAWSRYPNQNGQSCFGHAWAQAIRTQSKGTLDPSAIAIWGLARELGLAHPDPSVPLADDGVYGHDVLAVLPSFGVVARDRWPDDVDPGLWIPQDVIEAGQVAKLDAAYGIDADGDELVARIKQCVGVAEHPVVFGMDVDMSYMRVDGSGIWHGMQGPSKGGHAQCIDEYDEDFVGIAGSWGSGFGAAGRAYIPWPVFVAMRKYDFQAATFVPTRVL